MWRWENRDEAARLTRRTWIEGLIEEILGKYRTLNMAAIPVEPPPIDNDVIDLPGALSMLAHPQET